MKKRISTFILAVIMSVGLLAGCQSTPSTPASSSAPAESAAQESAPSEAQSVDNSQKTAEITIYTYYAESAKTTIDAALPEMQKLYPNVTFNIEHRTDADGSVLRTRAAVGELPEIMELTGALTETFVKSGDILPLDDAMDSMDFISKFIPNGLDGKQYSDGHYYAVGPSVPENFMVFYNKTVFEELNLTAPKNYEEFTAVVKALKDADKIPLALFGQEQWPGMQMYDLAVIASGNTDGVGALEIENVAASDPAYLNAATKVRDLIQLGLIGNGAFNTNSAQAMEMIKLGQAGMYVCGAWYLGDCAEYGDNIDFFDYNPFCDPGAEEELRWYKSAGSASAGGYGVSSNCEDPDFIKEIALNFSIEKTRANTKVNSVPNMLSEDVRPDTPRSESYERYATDIVNYKNMSKYGWALENPELYLILQDTTEKLLTGSMDPAAYVAELNQKIDAID